MHRTFRAITPPRHFPTPLRICRSLSHGPGGTLKLQRVRIRRPWLKRTVMAATTYAAAAYVWSQVALSPLDKVDLEDFEDEEEDNTPVRDRSKRGHNNDEPEMKDDDTLFIPLGWPRRVAGPVYSGKDPEWKAFEETNSNRYLMDQLRDELIRTAWESIARDEYIHRVIGGPIYVERSWITAGFPHTAPDEYVRSGLEIRDDGAFKWVTRPIPSERGDAIHNVFLPTSVAFALWDATLFFFQIKYKKLTGASEKQSKPGHARPLPSSPSSSSTSAQSQGPKEIAKLAPLRPRIINKTTKTDETQQSLPAPLLLFTQFFKPGHDLLAAASLFKHLVRRSWARVTLPKGVFFIHGLVGLRSDGGFCTVYVTGFYHPETDRWVDIVLEVKALSSWRLLPPDAKR
ncbi:hypothetical protein FQN57_005786 [Myotisia sp. PD_48]|nr:hypothetical protein FQN57_005786 [Myotisia sp. PD_48]